MKLLSFSGAATKIAAHAAHGKIILESGYKPDIYAGVSSGALIILPLILGKFDLLKEKTTNLKLSDIFNHPPVNEKGKITVPALARGAFKGSFGEMENVVDMIRLFVSEEEYNSFIKDKKSPFVYIGITNINKDKFELVLINKLKYESFIRVLVASSSIPMFVPPQKLGDCFYYDGGLKHHNPGIEVLRKYPHTIKECISVYSRPERYPSEKDIDWGYDGKYLGRNLSKTIEIMQNAISTNDQQSEIDICKINHIKLTQRFSPKIMKGIYDVNGDRLKELYNSII